MNQQRKVIYAERRRILEGENLQQQATDMLVDVITAYVDGATSEGYAEDWDLDALWAALKTLYPVGIKAETLTRQDQDSERDELTRDELLNALLVDAERAYAEREAELEELAGEGAMRQLERNVLLNVIDRKWREHLYEMDYLKEGIGLRAMAQRDPLVEYQREGYDMFTAMLDGMKEESVGFLFNVTVEAVPAPQVAPVEVPEGLAELTALEGAATATEQEDGAGGAPAAVRQEAPSTLRAKGIDDEAPALTYSGPSEDGSAQVQRNGGAAEKTPAGVQAGASRRERREAARRQGRGAKPPKSVKRR
jgi:preprotein translocase subunit SecA